MQLPGELFQEAVSVEYILQQPVRAPPAFVLVLDLSQSMEALAVSALTNRPSDAALSTIPQCTSDQPLCCKPSTQYLVRNLCVHCICYEMQDMKQSVKQMLQTLPDYCLVGLITFGAMVTGTDQLVLSLAAAQ